MDRNIHWILNQRHPDGTWHAIHSEPRPYDSFDGSLKELDAWSDFRLDQRSCLLSNVRDPAGEGGPLLAPGFPADPSDYARAANDSWGEDWHSQGHLTADMLEGRLLPEGLRPWLDRLAEIVASQDGAPALLPRVRDEDGETWDPAHPDAPQEARTSARAAAALRGQEAKGGP